MTDDEAPTGLTDPTRGSSEPDRMWTLTNVGEATPDILSPLCWSLWGHGVERASRAGLYDFGALRRSALAVPDDPNQWATACFYGRQAMNVDRARAGRTASRDDRRRLRTRPVGLRPRRRHPNEE